MVANNILLPDVSNKGFVALRYFSDMNTWIDFVIFVRKSDIKTVDKQVSQAFDDYWDEKFECYGDALDHYIKCDNIIIYYNGDESDEYEEAWENMLKKITNLQTMVL